MKYLKRFEDLNIDVESEKVDEGVKEWILAGALALASSGGLKAQKSTILNQPSNQDYVSQSKKIDTTITIDFGNEFESGTYKFDKSKAKETQDKLAKIADFVKKYNGSNIKITIEGSESLVPNIDKETGKRLPKGGLSKLRVDETKDLIDSYMDSLMGKGMFKGTYDTLTKMGTTPYKYGESPAQDKFKREQYVKVTLSASGHKEESVNKYAAYSKMGERVFKPNPYGGGGKALGDIFYRSRATQNINDPGTINTGYEDILLKTLNDDKEYAKTGKEYDGKMYLIPSAWWNGKRQTTSNYITDSDLEYIKKNFEVK
jgi:hypothetical protein